MHQVWRLKFGQSQRRLELELIVNDQNKINDIGYFVNNRIKKSSMLCEFRLNVNITIARRN